MKRSPFPTPDLLRARVAYALRCAGWPAWVGSAMLAAALLGVLVAAPRIRADTAALEQRGLELLRSGSERSPGTDAQRDDPLHTLTALLPPAIELPRFIETVYIEASRAGLSIERAEYRMQHSLGGAAQRYLITVPVRGGYPQLRRWLEQLLYAFPSAAVDELSMRRDPGAGAAEARVQLTFYFRSP